MTILQFLKFTHSQIRILATLLRILYIQKLPMRKRTSPMMSQSLRFISGRKKKKIEKQKPGIRKCICSKLRYRAFILCSHSFITETVLHRISRKAIALLLTLHIDLLKGFDIHRLTIQVALNMVTSHFLQVFCLFLCLYSFGNTFHTKIRTHLYQMS